MKSYSSSLGLLDIITALVCASAFNMAVAQTSDDLLVAGNRHLVEIRGHVFDPKEFQYRIDKASSVKKVPDGVYLVQFNSALNIDEIEEIKQKYGFALNRYVSGNTYIERLNAISNFTLRSDVRFRSIVPYMSDFRVSKNFDALTIDDNKSPNKALLIVAFPWANKNDLKTQIKDLGFEILTIVDEPNYEILRVVVDAFSYKDAKKLASLNNVELIEPLGMISTNSSNAQWVNQTNIEGDRRLWDEFGLLGQGQIIGIIDTPIDIKHCFFKDNENGNVVGPNHRKVVKIRNKAKSPPDSHGTFVAGVAAGEDFNKPSDGGKGSRNRHNGNAPKARLSYGNKDDFPEGNKFGTHSFYGYLRAAHEDGARIHNNSWDNPSLLGYSQLSSDLDRFAWEHETDVVLIAPKNLDSLHPPATSKNGVVVNASNNGPDHQDRFAAGVKEFSFDKRRKPDLLAPGSTIVSADYDTPCGVDYRTGASSFAAPSVAAMAALVRQYFIEGWYPSGEASSILHEPSGALVKAVLLNSTVDMKPLGYPDPGGSGEGWGRLLLDNSLYFKGDNRKLKIWDVKHSVGLNKNEDSNTHEFSVTGTHEPLKITLHWTEPPARSRSASPTSNNLDLVVTDKHGNSYYGNDIVTGIGESRIGTAPVDKVNTTEMVLISVPKEGIYTIKVVATEIGCLCNKPGQGYALVVTGDVK